MFETFDIRLIRRIPKLPFIIGLGIMTVFVYLAFFPDDVFGMIFRRKK